VSVAVVVPFRGGCPHREAAWSWVKARYAERHPDWQLLEAPAPDGPWCKGAALAPAIESTEAEIIVQADADVWADGLAEAVRAVADGAPWALPHTLVHRLTEEATAAVLAGADWRDQPLAQQPYKGIEGGGFVVASKTVLEAVPVDPRFVFWGQEDECHAIALRTLVGEPWRGNADLVHLFHPPQERMTRRRGSRESWDLRRHYFAASKDPAALAALVEEGRDALATAQSSMCSPSPVPG
jgi:hypothetical protein